MTNKIIDECLNRLGDSGDAKSILYNLLASGKVSVADANEAADQIAHSQQNHKKKGPNIEPKCDMVKPIEKHRTRHIALQFSYDGTVYSGFAQNVGKEYDNSVEKQLFAALEKTRLLVSPDENGMLTETERTEAENGQVPARTASKYSRCGRTDKGVHANGQVVALYLK